MAFTAKYDANGQISAGPMSDGQMWNAITEASRFWPELMALTNNGASIAPYVAPAPPIPSVSRRQFFQQSAVAGIIMQDEALAAVTTGALPASIVAFINGLPANQQFGTKMLFSADSFDRSSSIANAFGQTIGMTPAQIDAFFTAASQL